MKWQPIEMAPKDGTRVLGYFPCAGQRVVTVMGWRENVYERGDPNWTTDDGESACLTYDPPTHFMPLPEPPT
jgi:hypothetical protein